MRSQATVSFIIILSMVLSLNIPVWASSEEQVLLQSYRSAVEAGDPAGVKSAWKNLMDKFHLEKFVLEKLYKMSPELATHFWKRTRIEILNQELHAMELSGEIKPFSEMEGKMPDVRSTEPPAPRAKGDSGLADLVKKTKNIEARHAAKTNIKPQQGDTPTDNRTKLTGEPPKPGAKEFAKKTAGRVIDVVGATGLAAGGIRQESENAAKQGRDFSSFNALENVGKNVAHGSITAPYETGRRIAQEEINKIPVYEMEINTELEDSGMWEGLPAENRQLMAKAIARQQASDRAIVRTLKEMFYDNPSRMSKKILEEEALNEFNNARAAGEKELSSWRIAKYKGRAAARVIGEAIMLNNILDAATYDSDADRRASAMDRRLQAFAKIKLLDGLTKTTRIQEEINQLSAKGDPNDPAVKEIIKKLDEEYEASLVQVNRVKERLEGKVDFNDPFLSKLQNEVRRIPREPVILAQNQPTDKAAGSAPPTGFTIQGYDDSVADNTETREEIQEIPGSGGFGILGQEQNASGEKPDKPSGEFALPGDTDTIRSIKDSEEAKPQGERMARELRQMYSNMDRKKAQLEREAGLIFRDSMEKNITAATSMVAANIKRNTNQKKEEQKLPYMLEPPGPDWSPVDGWGRPAAAVDDTIYCPDDKKERQEKCARVIAYLRWYESQKAKIQKWTTNAQRAYLFKAQCCGYRWSTEGSGDDDNYTADTTTDASTGTDTGGGKDIGIMGVGVGEETSTGSPSVQQADSGPDNEPGTDDSQVPTMSYDECVLKICPDCSKSLGLMDLSVDPQCNTCKTNRKKQIDDCMAGKKTGGGGHFRKEYYVIQYLKYNNETKKWEKTTTVEIKKKGNFPTKKHIVVLGPETWDACESERESIQHYEH